MPGTPPFSPRFGVPRFANTDEVDFAGQVNAVTDAFDANIVETPIGGVLDWPWATDPPAPATWIECLGQVITRAAYPALFAAAGIPGGTDVMNVPDRRGRSPMGAGQGPTLTERIVGQLVGGETVTLSVAQLPSHGHSASASNVPNHNHQGQTWEAGAHGHTYGYGGWDGSWPMSGAVPGGTYSMILNPVTATGGTSTAPHHVHGIGPDGGHGHTITVHAVGSGAAVPIQSPATITRYFVRAA